MPEDRVSLFENMDLQTGTTKMADQWAGLESEPDQDKKSKKDKIGVVEGKPKIDLFQYSFSIKNINAGIIFHL